jgi:pilus assembly protein CpaE
MRAFLIDDEKTYYKLLKPALTKAGHELGYAQSGEEGLKKIAGFDPDVIVLDLKLEDTTGFAILERLQTDAHFRHVPVIFVTSSDELESKLKAFSLGAEDYVTKPFKPEELVARMEILARRREYLKAAESVATTVSVETSTVVTIHSLRGGVGCTSIAINLAFAYNALWNRPTIILDTILTSGQVAMFMNSSPRSTWKDVADLRPEELDIDLIKRLINQHKTGVRYVAAPKLPIPFETFIDTFTTVLGEYRKDHDFIVIDTPHDFSDIAIKTLDAADYILMVITPEMGSLRAAICAIQTYENLGYAADKIKVILNHVSQAPSLKNLQIEKAIGHKIDMEFPYAVEVNQAINLGEPFQSTNSNLQITQQLEDCAYNLSRESLKNLPPAVRSAAWTRVNRRLKVHK